jgi:hypothetical protein
MNREITQMQQLDKQIYKQKQEARNMSSQLLSERVSLAMAKQTTLQ